MTRSYRHSVFGMWVTVLLCAPYAAPSAAGATFVSDFENNSVLGSGWGASGNAPTATTEQARGGARSMRSLLTQSSGTAYRTEVTSRWNEVSDVSPNMAYGIDHWWGFSVYLPSTGPAGSTWGENAATWAILGQVHSTTLGPGPFFNPQLTIQVSAGDRTLKITNGGSGTIGTVNLGTLKSGYLDRWIDFVIHMVFNTNAPGTSTNVPGNPARGMGEVWVDGVRVFNNQGPWQNDAAGSPYPPYWKMGIYNGWGNATIKSDDAANGLTSMLAYHDEFRYASGPDANYSMVAPVRPATPAPPVNVVVQ